MLPSLGPDRGYYNALVGGLDAPEIVVDAFQVVRLGNVMVDDVRRRVRQDTLGHRGRTHDPLYGIRRLLLTGEERLTACGRQRIAAGLAAGDRDDQVRYAWTVKGQLRAVYRDSKRLSPATRWPTSTTSPQPRGYEDALDRSLRRARFSDTSRIQPRNQPDCSARS